MPDEFIPKTRSKTRKSVRRSGRVGASHPSARSRITNGSAFVPFADGRSKWARIARDHYVALIAHCGGFDFVSETRRMTCRRVAVLEAELIYLEDGFADARVKGREPLPLKLDLYGRLADRQRRLSEALGWNRAQRDVTPSLDQYLARNDDDDDFIDGEVVP